MKKKKRLKGILITLAVLALLGGGGYVGVKRYLAGREKSVEVYAVKDLNGADWLSYYSDTTSSGMVVSDVSQNVYVPDDKVVNEVYVSEGDEVKIGDKLLSYDTTLLELDRESQDLELQELDLELEAAEADLKKLQNTTPVAYKPEEDYDYLDPDDLDIPDDFEEDFEEEARMVPGDRVMLASQDAGSAAADAGAGDTGSADPQNAGGESAKISTDGSGTKVGAADGDNGSGSDGSAEVSAADGANGGDNGSGNGGSTEVGAAGGDNGSNGGTEAGAAGNNNGSGNGGSTEAGAADGVNGNNGSDSTEAGAAGGDNGSNGGGTEAGAAGSDNGSGNGGSTEAGAADGANDGNVGSGTEAGTEGGSGTEAGTEGGNGIESGAAGGSTEGQKETGKAPADEEQIIGEEQPNTGETWDFGDLDDFFGQPDGGAEEEKQPKMNQSLLHLLSHICVLEKSADEDVEEAADENTEDTKEETAKEMADETADAAEEGALLADTRREKETGTQETLKLTAEEIQLVPHFTETEKAHFERMNTYSMRIKGITLKEEKSGKLYGTARINGEDYPEIGGYTVIQDPEHDNVVYLTLAFHDGLNEQHEISAELEDVYAKITLSPDEIVGKKLTFRTKKKENDIYIGIERAAELTDTQADTNPEDNGTEEAGGDGTEGSGGMEGTGGDSTEGSGTEGAGGDGTEGSGSTEGSSGTEEAGGDGTEGSGSTEGASGDGTEGSGSTEGTGGDSTEGSGSTESTDPAQTEPATEQQTEPGTEPQTEPEQMVAATSQILFDVTWYHGTNQEAFWPRSLSIELYDMEDSGQENILWSTSVPKEDAPEETPELDTEAGTEDPNGDSVPERETSGNSDTGADGANGGDAWTDGSADSGNTGADGTDAGADGAADTVPEMDYAVEGEIEHVIGLEENTYSSTHLKATRVWDTSLGEPDLYRMVVRAADSLDYIPSIEWGVTDEQGVRLCTITMKYLEPQESPLVKLEPLSELTYRSGAKGMYYKGSGTKDDPYVFFCTDGAVIKNTFVNWVLGFDADGLVREREGCYVLLEIRESDTITGAFIRSIGLDGTILMDHGYGPGSYWIFASDSGITRYEEDIPDPIDDGDLDIDEPGWDDWGDTYTAEELAEAIKDKEREIRRLKLDIKEGEMKLKQYDRDLDASVVVSAVDGYVKSLDGTNGEAYMVVTNEGGLYLRTSVSELDLATVKVGDTLNVTSWESGDFTASITEVSTYPSTSDMYYSYGGGQNPNSSNYPVIARIEDTSGLSPYEYVQVKFRQPQTASNSIYITVMYVRSENGQSYVYKTDQNGLLKKQYVRTGRTIEGYLEIKDGLSNEDYIAFPYGKSVKDGAKTTSAYGDEEEEFY